MEYCLGIILSAIIPTHSSPNVNKYLIRSIAKNVCLYARRRNINPYDILSIIRHESSFKPKLKSKTKDHGLMQVNQIWKKRIKCNLYRIKCNIKAGTMVMALFRRSCMLHKKAGKHLSTHWLRHYNWNNKKHHMRILWLSEAYKRAADGHEYLYDIIKSRKKYYKLTENATYSCIKENLCGAL